MAEIVEGGQVVFVIREVLELRAISNLLELLNTDTEVTLRAGVLRIEKSHDDLRPT